MTCNVGDKPIITYQFSGQSQKVYKSDFSPIDVIGKQAPVEATDNYSSDGYRIGFYSPNNGFDVGYTVRDWKLRSDNNAFLYMPCGSTTFTTNGPEFSTTRLSIDTNQKCPSTQTNRCSIQVVYKNLVIFQDQGNCPVTYSVQCGECPDGYCKCETAKYPGYCCISCGDMKNEVIAITNAVKDINKKGSVSNG